MAQGAKASVPLACAEFYSFILLLGNNLLDKAQGTKYATFFSALHDFFVSSVNVKYTHSSATTNDSILLQFVSNWFWSTSMVGNFGGW